MTEKNQYNTIFWAFILLHVTLWTLAPMWVRFNLPMDSIEGAVWSQKLAFGYDKAPLLNAWITAFAIWLWGYVDWAIYLTSQLSVAICFIALWQLAKKILQPIDALLAVIILEGFQYYNIGAIDFDDNVLQLPLWALSCLFFYQALNEKKRNYSPLRETVIARSAKRDEANQEKLNISGLLRPAIAGLAMTASRGRVVTKNLVYWSGLGVFAGLAMLAKYYAVLLFFSMLAFLCLRENRHYFSEKGVYLAFGIFLVVISPHIIWLFQNDFLTLHYVFRRVGDLPTWTSHVINPLLFLRDEAYALIIPSSLFGLLFVGVPCYSERSEEPPSRRRSLAALGMAATVRYAQQRFSTFDRNFLIYLGLGPFLLAIAISIVTGIKLHIMWGSALFSLWGILFIGLFPPMLNPKKICRFFTIMLLLFFTTLTGYLLSIQSAKNTSSAHFPGRIIANDLTESWYQHYHQPLAYVIGSRWLAGNLAFYSPLHPMVLIDGDVKLAPWLNRVEGALLIWDANRFGNTIPKAYQRWVIMQNAVAEIKTFNWHKTPNEDPVKIGILFSPPTNLR